MQQLQVVSQATISNIQSYQSPTCPWMRTLNDFTKAWTQLLQRVSSSKSFLVRKLMRSKKCCNGTFQTMTWLWLNSTVSERRRRASNSTQQLRCNQLLGRFQKDLVARSAHRSVLSSPRSWCWVTQTRFKSRHLRSCKHSRSQDSIRTSRYWRTMQICWPLFTKGIRPQLTSQLDCSILTDSRNVRDLLLTRTELRKTKAA